MHTFYVSVPAYELSLPSESDDFGVVIENARELAFMLDAVAYITMEGAGLGCPNRWAVSPKGYVSVESVQPLQCAGCGES